MGGGRTGALALALVMQAAGVAVGAGGAAADDTAAKMRDMGLNIMPVLGLADFCGVDGGNVVDVFTRSLPLFGFSMQEVTELEAAMAQRRRDSRAETARGFAAKGVAQGQCPAHVTGQIRTTLDELEQMWRRVVRNETGVDMGSLPAQAAPPAAAPPSPPPPAPAPAPSAGAAVPPGKYPCYTFEAGQLNYTYTDVVIASGNRYSVGNSSGNYNAAGNKVTFTGPMSNVVATLSIKNGGVPQLDLVFDGDPRKSMSCSRR